MTLIPLFLLGFTGGPADGWPLDAPLDRVLIISVDGLRSDALLAAGPDLLPHFHRLLDGISTLNARTDPDITVTLPNHIGMLTGLRLGGEAGHRWRENVDPPPGRSLHDQAGRYVPGVFDVAHDHGLSTGLFAGKSKFSLFDLSWDETHGAPDQAGVDQGRDKIDRYYFNEDTPALVDEAAEAFCTGSSSLVFLHFRPLDIAGHASGWDLTPGSPYLRAAGRVDAELGRLIAVCEARQDQGERVGIVLTADHGGGVPFRGHSGGTDLWVNFIVPLAVWSLEFTRTGDLYELWPTRWSDPGLTQARTAAKQPVRNLDAGQIALELLNLPPMKSSPPRNSASEPH